ncbi:MAG TPA: hypothetical protein VF064_06840 [Pyrinomonadaceae bacterium]
MQQKLTAAIIVLALAALVAACGGAADNTTTNANMTTTATVNSNAAGLPATGSEIMTETADGVTTETRIFKDPNSPVEKVVVTTRGGKRTARVYYRDKTVRELPDNAVEGALVSTADKLEDAGGKVVDVSKDIGSEVGDKAEDVGDKTVSGAKKVGAEAADKAEDVGDKAVSGAKKAGSATVKGAKKAGSAVKDAVTP